MSALFPEAVAQTLRQRLTELYRANFRRVAASETHFLQMADDSLNEARSLEALKMLERFTGPLAGKRMLEIGSGIGMTVAVARKSLRAEAFGVEPGDDEYSGTLDFSLTLLKAADLDSACIQAGVGEQLPFPDDHFDVVFSSNVLEHVNTPPAVLAEAVRVLKPGGVAQFVVPNYGSWWEGHFGVLWLPHTPRWLGKLYARALGRDETFIDTLQFVTRGKLERWMAPQRARVDILGWGVDVWENRVRNLNFSEYSALSRLKSILRLLHTLKVVSLIVALGKALHWETPFILTFQKRRT